MSGEEKALRKEKRRKFWGQQLRKGKNNESAQGEADSAIRKTKLNKDGKRGRKFGKDGGNERKLSKDKRKEMRGKTREKNLSNRGFKSGQGSVSAVGSTEAVIGSTTVELHTSSVNEEKEMVESDTESVSIVEPTANTPAARVGSGDTEKLGKKTKKRRYLLFMGNLPQTSTREEIVSHFERRGVHIAEFRLLSHKDTGKSKGCGFMEFASDKDIQNALKFHHTRVLGKRINVEVTCGGGGKSERRREKITQKNRTLQKSKAMANRSFKPKTSSQFHTAHA